MPGSRGEDERDTRWFPLIALLVIIVVFSCIVLFDVTGAKSHEWYPPECCSDKDCRELREWEVTEVPGGYQVVSDNSSAIFTIPYKDAKLSPDGRFHKCEGRSIILCFYAPKGSF